MVKDKNAFAPFSLGPYNCVGRRLAWMELRLVTAVIVQGFDITLAEGETGEKAEGEMQDSFTVVPGNLRLVFRRRG